MFSTVIEATIVAFSENFKFGLFATFSIAKLTASLVA
jgi:hypothetical protein